MSIALFYIGALPTILAFMFWFITYVLLSNAISSNPKINEKWSGWGGAEFSKDIDMLEDGKVKKLLFVSEKICPKVFVIGIVLTIIMETIFANL